MQNIIKALNYQTRRDNFTVYAALAACWGFFIMLIEMPQMDLSEITGSVFVINTCEMFAATLTFGIIILACRICGWDYGDKTINYEIMSGHNRAQVYWGRVLVALAWCMGMVLIVMLLPLTIVSLINGWGVNIDFWGYMGRLAFMLLPILRMICECIFLTFVVRNGFVGMIVSYMLIMGSTIVHMIVDTYAKINIYWAFSLTNMMEIAVLGNSYLGFVDGEDVTIYETAMEPSVIIYTLLASLIAIAACLLGGYAIFRKRDLH